MCIFPTYALYTYIYIYIPDQTHNHLMPRGPGPIWRQSWKALKDPRVRAPARAKKN